VTLARRFAVIELRTLALLSSILVAGAGPAAAQWYQGPSGGPGGQAFDDWNANGHATNIRRVTVWTSKADHSIHCILTFYPNPAAPTDPNQTAAKAGSSPGCGNGALDLGQGMLLDPDEYILGISGQYSDHITSLRFYTNKRNSPVYGEGGGRTFGYTAPLGQMIVAFTGSGDTRLRSLGVMYAPCNRAIKACK
jgi:hypothetical protein